MNNVHYNFVGRINNQNKSWSVLVDQFYNFYVYEFPRWIHLLLQNAVWSCHFLRIKFLIDKTNSHEKMTKMKAVRIQ
jgi:hypothetical protein